MKLVFEVTMISGKKYKLTREAKEKGVTKENIISDFEKELSNNEFILTSTEIRLRSSKIESYNIILGSPV